MHALRKNTFHKTYLYIKLEDARKNEYKFVLK